MDDMFYIHTKEGLKSFSRSEILQNVMTQEAEGIKPSYSFWDYERKEAITPPGWLIWSTLEDGCCVVYRNKVGNLVIQRGWQGEYVKLL